MYEPTEISHGLNFIYNLILWLIRDQADQLSLSKDNLVWLQSNSEVGRFPINIPQPTPSFKDLLDLVIERDEMIGKHIQVAPHESDVYIITAYEPDPMLWEPDFKKKKEQDS